MTHPRVARSQLENVLSCPREQPFRSSRVAFDRACEARGNCGEKKEKEREKKLDEAGSRPGERLIGIRIAPGQI